MGRKPAYSDDYEVRYEDSIGTRIAKRRAQLDAAYKEKHRLYPEYYPEDYKNLTQQRLAEACQVSRDTVKNWETGKSYPSLENLEKICEVLDCDFDFILGRINVPYLKEFDIERHLGLSAKSRLVLYRMPRNNEKLLRVFDKFVSDENFIPFLETVKKYLTASERVEYIKNNPDPADEDKIHYAVDMFDTERGLSGIRTEKAVLCYLLEALDLVRNFMERAAESQAN